MMPLARRIWNAARIPLAGLLLAFVCLIVSFEVYAIVTARTEGHAALPPTFGNFQRVVDLLPDDTEDEAFSFAVAGDTTSCGTYERLAEELKDEPVSFMVLLGDCVRDGTEGNHMYFRAELSTELATPYPVFYVVGNHDVDPERFPLSQFESMYGPTNFFFRYHNSLFVFLRALPGYRMDETIGFLENVLSTHRRDSDKVFVFMHIPPIHASTFAARNFENEEALVALFEKYHVDYVCAGDYHGYARGEVNGTVYLVTGGGGAHLKDAKFGAFHHAVVITVEPNAVHERILFVPRDEDLEDGLERFALAEFVPWISARWPLVIFLNVAATAVLVCAVRLLARAVRLRSR